MMKRFFIITTIIIITAANCNSQNRIDSIMPVRGFCIAAPRPAELNDFITFIKEELAPRKVNTLILRVDFNFRYESHPELSDPNPLSKNDVEKIVKICREEGIKIIPQINLLGHQSWAERTGNLLRVYPQFDETPGVKMPDKYVWPNTDKLYCKSYCPLHPEVHDIVFDLVDEICDVFEAADFHAGMDEVFYIGEDQCPRCSGRDKAELFAGEVTQIRNHLTLKDRRLWIWGDRLLDGKTTGMGEWEASYNNTYRAIDMIPKDVMICDWHYEKAHQSAVYFAMKGFSVVTCPYNNRVSGVAQVKDMVRFRSSSSEEMAGRFSGIVQTVWSGAGQFMNNYHGLKKETGENSTVSCFRAVFNEISKPAK
jgi:hypothetical protein